MRSSVCKTEPRGGFRKSRSTKQSTKYSYNIQLTLNKKKAGEQKFQPQIFGITQRKPHCSQDLRLLVLRCRARAFGTNTSWSGWQGMRPQKAGVYPDYRPYTLAWPFPTASC